MIPINFFLPRFRPLSFCDSSPRSIFTYFLPYFTSLLLPWLQKLAFVSCTVLFLPQLSRPLPHLQHRSHPRRRLSHMHFLPIYHSPLREEVFCGTRLGVMSLRLGMIPFRCARLSSKGLKPYSWITNVTSVDHCSWHRVHAQPRKFQKHVFDFILKIFFSKYPSPQSSSLYTHDSTFDPFMFSMTPPDILILSHRALASPTRLALVRLVYTPSFF